MKFSNGGSSGQLTLGGLLGTPKAVLSRDYLWKGVPLPLLPDSFHKNIEFSKSFKRKPF